MKQKMWASFWSLLMLQVSCYNAYPFLAKTTEDLPGVHLRFEVNSPSKADILLVLDNSSSMKSKQTALLASLQQMLTVLGQKKTSYRLAITSTDAHGFLTDCQGQKNPYISSNILGEPSMGARGNCTDPQIQILRPYDGSIGRLLAAFDSSVFAPEAFADLSNEVVLYNNTIHQKTVDLLQLTAGLVPTSLYTGYIDATLHVGPRWVVDHDTLHVEACNACGCLSCALDDDCEEKCVEPVVAALVKAYVLANVSALGDAGFGWEEGLKTALWAIGIDPEQPNDWMALNPIYQLTSHSGTNRVSAIDANTKQVVTSSWLREDALLAILFLTDEQDCSMPRSMMQIRSYFEDNQDAPVGSMCYQAEAMKYALDTNRLARLLKTKKAVSGQIVISVIAGLQKTGVTNNTQQALTGADAIAADCSLQQGPNDNPKGVCSCLSYDADKRWCNYTQSGSGSQLCDAMAGSRYVDFAKAFDRHYFESICRHDAGAYQEVLERFAQLATVACFALQGISPSQTNQNAIVVQRTAQGSSIAQTLQEQSPLSLDPGWYYDLSNNSICLTGIERLIGDKYDILMMLNNTSQ